MAIGLVKRIEDAECIVSTRARAKRSSTRMERGRTGWQIPGGLHTLIISTPFQKTQIRHNLQYSPMKLKKFARLRPIALARHRRVPRPAAPAADTILDFDTLPNRVGNNDNVAQTFGDAVSASSDGITVVGFARRTSG